MNDLFSELGFEYRFKDNYYVRGLQINEQPCLYQIQNQGSIDENEQRKLADLSDGEKAIISLSFASLSGVKQEDRKILLLDEFDANFNPSLTEVFFKILDGYFISKGILVVIATHSATTIALAPDNASFYEVFKKSSTQTSRILPVQKDDYAELEIANRSFYKRIADQTKRIAELEKEKTDLQDKINESHQQTKPFLFVEGDIDVQYLNKAADFYEEWKKILEGMELKAKNGKGELSNYWKKRTHIKEFIQHPVILIFDCDTNQSDEDDPLFYKRSVPIPNGNSIKKGIESLFEDALILKAEESGKKKFTLKSTPNNDEPNKQEWIVIDNEKKNLADWICKNGSKDDFKNFHLIFDKVKEITNVGQNPPTKTAN